MARTVRKVHPRMKPWTAEDIARMGDSRGQIRGVTLERLNARLNKDHGAGYSSFPSWVRRMFNRLHRSKQNQALRKNPCVEILPHKLENDKWGYD